MASPHEGSHRGPPPDDKILDPLLEEMEEKMGEWLEGLEPVVAHQDLKVPYRYSMGPVSSRFFIEIRDNRKIMGIRCPKCNLIFVPPRSTCGRCFSQLDEWVEAGQTGKLETYTQVHYSTPVQPTAAPFYYGIIKLDGADTGLAHLVGGLNGQKPRIGMRVQAVFREDRKGNMLDISYFRPVEGEKPVRARVRGVRSKKKAGRAIRRKDAKSPRKVRAKKNLTKKTADRERERRINPARGRGEKKAVARGKAKGKK